MHKSLSTEKEILIKQGVNLPCPACGEPLSIENQELDNGSKSRVYRCIESKCKEYAGVVILPWYNVIFYLVSKKVVAVCIVLLVAVTGFVTKSINQYINPPNAQSSAISSLHDKLNKLGCSFKDTDDDKKKLAQSNACLDDYLLELSRYREDVEWAKKQSSSVYLSYYLKGKAESLNKFEELGITEKTKQNLKKIKTMTALIQGRNRGYWEGNKMIDSYCAFSDCGINVSDDERLEVSK
jgi:predicted RNA-binding Zn-ribbon protein involved in translation (DUF1610 family)